MAALIPPGYGRLRAVLDSEEISVIESEFDFSFSLRPRLLHSLLALRRQIRSHEPDILFYHLYASALAARLASLFMRIRRVHMVAGPLYLDSRLIRLAERFLCRLDNVVIAGSEYTAERYRALGMRRVVAIPYGVDLNSFSPDQVEPVVELGGHDTFKAVMVAYVYAPKSSVYPGVGIKGHEVLLTAWNSFVAKHPESRLAIVGAGFDAHGERHRQALIGEWSQTLGDTVRWVSTVDDVRPWYRAADISISPSLSENHGAALEASAMTCPSVVSTAGALPETVLDSESGFLFTAGDAEDLWRALELSWEAWRGQRLEVMGARARQHMEDGFELKRCVRQVADAVEGYK